LAKRLGFRFLDTGAMYRAVTLAGLRRGIDWDDEAALALLAAEVELRLTDDCIFLDGEDVTALIRTSEITALTRHAADNRQVRLLLVDLQRELAAGEDVVAEGRDQATVAFPEAECKIYLTASDEVRAVRRLHDLVVRGEQVTLAEVLEKQRERDRNDLDRQFGGLRKAPDSIEINTDGMSPTEVLDRLEQLVRTRQNT
jgi:cytidylate kinase